MSARNPVWIVGNPHDRSITGFRYRHGSAHGPMSKSAYYRLRNAGLGPVETPVSANRVIITVKDEKAWEKARANPSGTEAKLVAKMKKARIKRAKKAAIAAKESPNHVSKSKQQTKEA
jgi:hypothetical protein